LTKFHRSDKSLLTQVGIKKECIYMELSFQKMKVKLPGSIISLYVAPAEFKISNLFVLRWGNEVM
jgi:hypothetical protein